MSDATATPSVTDNALAAAEGTRVAARWLASALGAIPSLAVLASIVRAPGEAGFEPWKLGLGIGLAAAGALLGVLAFARVLTPLALEDKDLEGLNLRRLPGQPFDTIAAVNTDTDKFRAGVTAYEGRLAEALAASKVAESAAERAESEADDQEKAGAPGAKAARAEADKERAAADAATARATALAGGLQVWNDQLTRREAIRRDAFLLKSADLVRERFQQARWATGGAVLLIATGTVLLGLAPKAKAAPSVPVLLTLTLNQAGKTALGCDVDEVPALKVGGTDTAPKVITLPGPACPSKTFTFTAEEPQPMGTVRTVRPSSGP